MKMNQINTIENPVGFKESILANYYNETDSSDIYPVISQWIIEHGEPPSTFYSQCLYNFHELLPFLNGIYGDTEPCNVTMGSLTDEYDSSVVVCGSCIKLNTNLWVRLSGTPKNKFNMVRVSNGENITADHIVDIRYYFTTNYRDEVIKLFENLKTILLRRSEHIESHISLLTQKGLGTLTLNNFNIECPIVDFDLMYNEGFSIVHNLINSSLNTEENKGLVILHGASGTGKTTYIKYLISQVKKRVIYLPPNMVNILSNPEFLTFLVDHKDSVIIIEDAENILGNRIGGNNQSVSNILNLSDGILSDVLHIQIICTFNASLSTIDEALLRKGRLICEYEFKPLEEKRVKALAKHLGIDDTTIKTLKEQPLSDVFNLNVGYHSDDTHANRRPIGFKFDK